MPLRGQLRLPKHRPLQRENTSRQRPSSYHKKAADVGKFKIGLLRNVALTAPYMHNGMVKTLAEVIDFYDDPGKVIPNALNRNPLLAKPLGLTDQEKKDLENFLRSLTDKRFLSKATQKKQAE